MKTLIYYFKISLILSVTGYLSQCVVPLNTSFESAKMLKKGEVEFMGSYAHYSVANDGESEAINNNVSARIGIGISDVVNAKLRYARLMPTEDGGTGVNYLAIAPKVRIVQNYLAATAPVGAYFGGEDGESDEQFFISPKVLFTYPASDNFEATMAAKADIFFEKNADTYVGFNLGFGISSDLDQWAFRPEVGLLFNTDKESEGRVWSLGAAVAYTLNQKE